jgi:flavodoxin
MTVKKILFIAFLFFCMETFMEAQNQNQRILIAYFSWGGNTEGIARQIQQRAGGDRSSVELFVIEPVTPYSQNYTTVLQEAQRDQRAQARPPLKSRVSNMAQYDVILLGYPTWWATIPMPIATFLESYDFAGKTIIPFCSHGGGRFGQSLTDIAKLAPGAKYGEALSVHYTGGPSLPNDISAWLRKNGIAVR